MTKILKFRAWDEESKKMIYWTLNDLLVRFNNTEKYEGDDVPSPFFEWMQSTGIFDKNGKEVYTGDILRVPSFNPQRHEVVFNRGGFCLKYGEDSNFYPDIKYAEDERSEIIGNIYQNKELLND